jgi:hypothetical protein
MWMLSLALLGLCPRVPRVWGCLLALLLQTLFVWVRIWSVPRACTAEPTSTCSSQCPVSPHLGVCNGGCVCDEGRSGSGLCSSSHGYYSALSLPGVCYKVRTPTAVIWGNPRVGSCDSLLLSGALSLGGMGERLRYTWTAPTLLQTSSLNTFFSSLPAYQPMLTVPSHPPLLPLGASLVL